jgi:hypothetical protein
MRLRKLLPLAAFIMLSVIALPASSAIIAPEAKAATTENVRAQQLVQRLESIKSMDRSELTRSEKKDLRNEVQGIKKEMKEMKGGVYLSVGAIIIVILLLILIL